MTARCDRPPAGWECRHPRGHSGPCPTWPARSPAGLILLGAGLAVLVLLSLVLLAIAA